MTQFKDLIFKDHKYMLNAHHVFDNNWEISVSSFEIAIFNPKGDFATSEVLQIDDDVAGWQGREDINNIIEMIISQ